MKKFTVALVLIMISIQASYAADFSSVSPSGHTLYYNITDADNHYVCVTYPGGSFGYSGYTKPSGHVTIPSTVIYNDTTYTVTAIGHYAFFSCNGITSISIPNTIIIIGNASFNGCYQMSSITFPNSVRVIEAGAFPGGGLSSITMSDSIEYCGERNFDETSWYNQQPSGQVYLGPVLLGYKGAMPTNTTITVVEGTRAIAGKCFYQKSNLIGINFPNTLKGIGPEAFRECSNLSSVTIPISLKYIGVRAFYSCGNLTTVNYNAKRSSFFQGYLDYGSPTVSGHNDVFGYCNNLTTFNIGDSVEIIPDGAFNSMQHISTIYFPESVRYIGDNSFDFCTNLLSINIPENVEFLGTAFTGCSNLSTVAYNAINCSTMYQPFGFTSLSNLTIGQNVRVIPPSLFSSCSNISGHLIIPNSVEFIGYHAFYNCSGITELTIGASVDSIGSGAFSGMSSLNTVHYNATDCSVASGVGGSNLSHFYIGSNVVSLPEGLIMNCPNLTSVSFPNSLTSIGCRNFMLCGITGVVTFPESLSQIGTATFYSCPNITEVISLSSEPPTIITNNGTYVIFYGSHNATLSVPCSSIEAYQNAVGWSDFTNIQGLSGCVTITTTSNNESYGIVEGGGSYSIGDQATLTATPFSGYRFDHWQDGNTNNPRTITVTADATFVAYFTSNAGIDDIDDAGINVYAKDYQIHIDEAIGEDITVYTIDGRAIATLPKATEHIAIPVTNTGVYIVKIGRHAARKVVVIR